MRVDVVGRIVAGDTEGEPFEIDVRSYRLLAPPSGETPVVGIVSTRMGFGVDPVVILETDEGVYDLAGKLALELDDWWGSKVWVTGRLIHDLRNPKKLRLHVSGFGVIRAKTNFIEIRGEGANMLTNGDH